MYLNFYRLNSKPFQITTDTRFLWLGEKHSEALATLKYGILEDKGFLLLTGDVGTGKTALIKLLVKSIDISAIVATIPDPSLEAADFFNILAEEFKMDRRFASKGDFLIYFKQFLLKAHTTDKKVLLIIDEAQRLHHDLLEQIRLLSNIELENRKLINIFFVGQTEFNRTLLEERNKAVRQRITVHYHIEPLAELETQQYIRHRLGVAGCKTEIFTIDAMRRIHAFSAGYPRLINIICDHALLTGYAGGTKAIDVSLIRDCEKELRLPEGVRPQAAGSADKSPPAPVAESPARASSRRTLMVLVFLLLATFAGLMFYQYRSEKPQRWAVEDIAPQTYKGLAGVPLLDAQKDESTAAQSPGPPAASPPPKAAAPEAVSSESLARNPFARGKVIIFFPYNSNELTPEGLAALDRIAEFLKANPSLKAEIRGYTDSVGAVNYNVSVSAFRANSIKSYLTGKGVSSSNLIAQGLGPKNPIASNDTLEGREQNRRVEIEPVL
ncbi:MAG: OmpA family protein [Deltaproteobacteria bacterium]|nr:OmpA family protein [Deltaproteobacteria bacterium]